METKTRTYMAIDLKSFYASVECVERNLNPLTANLVVADASRTEKTICLAVSPALKALGIPGRPRLFEVVSKIKSINSTRSAKDRITYITAPPRMALYMEYSTRIYNIYLKYVAPEDMHVYSVDEVFLDVTQYLDIYKMSPKELAGKIMEDIRIETGITATCGIGTNLYLCKIAMDIWAKHIQADESGRRIAQLDEMSYRRFLWGHKPLTDFWRVGSGYAKKLEAAGIYTMGDIARCSIGKEDEYYNEELLYKMFGVNAQLLIDHAWGYEPCTIADIKAYKPESESMGAGQVLHCPYTADKAKLVVMEMTDQLVLDLVDKGFVTDQIVLTVGYDIDNLTDPHISKAYKGEITTDRYGRKVPKHAHGTANLPEYTSSTKMIMKYVGELYDRIIDSRLLVRRMSIAANRIIRETDIPKKQEYVQMDLFTDYSKAAQEEEINRLENEKEKKIQQAMLDVKKKFGKNALVKGMNLREGATAIERNGQIGGHKA